MDFEEIDAPTSERAGEERYGLPKGIAREQTSMFPPTIEELIPGEYMVRVIAWNALHRRNVGFDHANMAASRRAGGRLYQTLWLEKLSLV